MDDLNIDSLKKDLNFLQKRSLKLREKTGAKGVEPTASYNRIWEALEYLDYLETNYGVQAVNDMHEERAPSVWQRVEHPMIDEIQEGA